jgi:hypothetical protein
LSVTRELVRLSQRVIVMNSDDHDTLYAMDYARSMERELRKVDIY